MMVNKIGGLVHFEKKNKNTNKETQVQNHEQKITKFINKFKKQN
jgi:hypothetical protein